MEAQDTIAEAKNKLYSIIRLVEQGFPVRLTRRGRAVAVMLSVGQYDRLSRGSEGYWKALESFRNQMKVENVQISDTDFEGLRDDACGREVQMR